MASASEDLAAQAKERAAGLRRLAASESNPSIKAGLERKAEEAEADARAWERHGKPRTKPASSGQSYLKKYREQNGLLRKA
jgi:hypothetical protein